MFLFLFSSFFLNPLSRPFNQVRSQAKIRHFGMFLQRIALENTPRQTRGFGVIQHPQLSRRESEVLALVAVGLANAAIAQKLYISEATVKVHMRHIFEKLCVSSRT